MIQLIEQIASEYNLTQEEATGIVSTVKNYLAANAGNEDAATVTSDAAKEIAVPMPAAVTADAAPAEAKEESIFEKATHFIEDHIPGGLKEKAEEMLGGVGNKIKGLFN
jgi:hypothetical protein